MKRIIAVPILAALGLLLTLSFAFAQDITIKSKGMLDAGGVGAGRALVVTGSLKLQIKGTFSVEPGDVKVDIKGNPGKKTAGKDKKTGKIGGYLYKDVAGTVTFTGEKYIVTFDGGASNLHVSINNGAGKAMLVGTGIYTRTLDGVKGKHGGHWSMKSNEQTICEPVPVEFGVTDVKMPPAPPKPAKK